MSDLTIPQTIGGLRLAKPFNDNFAAIAAWANGNIGQSNLASKAVNSQHLVDGSVLEPKLGDKCVSGRALQDYAVTSAKLSKSGLYLATAGGTGGTTWNLSTAQSAAPSVNAVAFAPSIDCTLIMSGSLSLYNAASMTKVISVFFGDGTANALCGYLHDIWTGAVTVPMACTLNLTAGTAYNLSVRATVNSSTASPLMCWTGWNALVVPR